MCAFDEMGCLKRYESVTQIMKAFFDVRMKGYVARKDYLEGILQAEAAKLSNQARFICEKCDGNLVIENKKKKDMIAELIRQGYASDPVAAWKMSQNREDTLVSSRYIKSRRYFIKFVRCFALLQRFDNWRKIAM